MKKYHAQKEKENGTNFFKRCKETWSKMLTYLLQKLIESMPDTLEAVIQAKKLQTKY